VSPATFPFAVNVFAVPPVLNVNPFELVGTNVQLPPPFVSELIVHNAAELGLITAMLVSVDAKPVTRTVTVIPLGPWLGLNVNAVMVPVNVC
jgi:hypothetical protein